MLVQQQPTLVPMTTAVRPSSGDNYLTLSILMTFGTHCWRLAISFVHHFCIINILQRKLGNGYITLLKLISSSQSGKG